MVNYKGETAFLCCGGPSLAQYDLQLLNGSLVAAVNNAPVTMWRKGVRRTALWFSIDSPHRFHPDIFADPITTKFVWSRFCEGNLHVGEGERKQWKASRHDVRRWNGTAWVSWQPATEFPNVSLYDLAEVESIEQFANSPNAVRGIGRHKSVMFAALWSLHRMGCKRIILLGCDLHCDPLRPYAWEETKTADACADLNNTLHWLRESGLQEIGKALALRGTEVVRVAPNAFYAAIEVEALRFRFNRADGLYTNL